MQELMDIVEQAVAGIDKKVAGEIKNLKNPASVIKEVFEYAAKFLDSSDTPAQIQNVQSKLYDYVRKGIGSRDAVTEEQLETLRAFGRSGLTADQVKAKSYAVANLATYLLAVLEL